MQLEPIRIIADWLADESTSYGVNAQLQFVELDAGDDRPDDVTVWDSTRHGWVSRKQLSREGSGVDFPAIAVTLASELLTAGAPQSGDVLLGEISIAIGFVEEDGNHASDAAAALYTLRAAKRSLRELNKNDYAASHRTRNSIYLENLLGISDGPANVQWKDAVVTSAIVTRWKVRDQAANALTS